ncbi:lipocalin family protein [Nitrincola tapanii]|uniref:Outer membrane lipoprotein Blc n=1 Tax=Nitrincola tapanii TaxID=1708751 RepID=A0A5A9W1S5_9GAMM|nr:lipocalin family protein [Nitrincola tapanii]KAA0874444.1 lipocalin [Nitrincola tapanii]
MKHLLLGLSLLFLLGCSGMPKSVQPVAEFELQRYLGTWYEIARLDHSFERGLSQVTAEYSMRSDGGVRVLNRGFSEAEQRWKEAEGRAYFVGDRDKAYLKVSFFGPFYGSYVIFDLDPEYQHAYISGPSHKYLWLLSRTPQVDPEILEDFVTKAQTLGFATESLIFVEHSQPSTP